MQRPAYYCVYRFHEEAEVDLDDVKSFGCDGAGKSVSIAL